MLWYGVIVTIVSHQKAFTYLLIPWSRVLTEKLTGFAANQEIPRILWNPKFHYRTHKRPPPVPILSQLHPIPTTSSKSIRIVNVLPVLEVLTDDFGRPKELWGQK